MYTLERFGGVSLPKYNTTEEISPRKRRSSTIELPAGGFYRHQGMTKAQPGLSTIKKSGEMIRGLDWEDATGLFGMIGSVDKLWRRDQDKDYVQWAWAELQNINSSRTARFNPIMPVEMSFLILSAWHGHRHEGSWVLDGNKQLGKGWFLNELANKFDFAGSTITIELPPGGNAIVEDAQIIISATTEISSLAITASGIHLNYIEPLAPGHQLILNCGPRQVTQNGVGVYRYLKLRNGHRQANWLPIPSDGLVLSVDPSRGHGSIEFIWSDCWE